MVSVCIASIMPHVNKSVLYRLYTLTGSIKFDYIAVCVMSISGCKCYDSELGCVFRISCTESFFSCLPSIQPFVELPDYKESERVSETHVAMTVASVESI